MLQPDITDDDVLHAAAALMAPEKKTEPAKVILARRQQFRSEVANALSHKNRAKAIYRSLDYELLKWTRELLTDILQCKEKEIKEKEAKEQNRQHIIKQMQQLMDDNNFTFQELYPDARFDEKTKRSPYKKKTKDNELPEKNLVKTTSGRIKTYKFYCHIFNRDYYWMGSGYLPTAFRCHLAKGHTFDSCKLPEDQWLKTQEKLQQTIPDEFLQSASNLINEANKQGIAKTRSELKLNENDQ